MKLGFVSAILPECNLDHVLGFAAAERFACVEVMCWPRGKAERKYAGVTHIDVTHFTRAQADDVNALYWNPAGLTLVPLAEDAAGHGNGDQGD